MPEVKDLAGQTFGRLTVLKRAPNKPGVHGARWQCQCDCGTKMTAISQQLSSGRTKSCGCLIKERLSKGLSRKHGLTNTVRWRMWIGSRRRAKLSGIPFNLKLEDIPQIPTTCPILSIPLKVRETRGASPNSPSLDRKIPSKGYVVGNVQVISHRANQIKSDASVEEVGKVYDYMRGNHGR